MVHYPVDFLTRHQKPPYLYHKLSRMKWPLIVLFGLIAIALIVFLVVRNQKDEKEFENQLKNDYRKPPDKEGDIEVDDTKQ